MTRTNLLRNLREPITRKIVLLVVLFFGALELLFGQYHLGQVYTARCKQRLENQYAKRSLGGVMRRGLIQAEFAVHGLADESDARNVRVARVEVLRQIESVERALTVLSNGGIYESVIRTNLVNTDEYREAISYTKDRNEGIVIEAIELVPQLADLEREVDELVDIVRKRIAAKDDTSRQALSDLIALHRKEAEATLLRSRETVNRIYSDTNQQLAAIERRSREVTARVQLVSYVTAGVLGAVCVLVAGITLRQAVGILEERKGLLGDLRKHRDRLDELVTVRTSELVEANQQLQQEVTERRQAEEALRESEGRLKALLNANPTGIVVIDAETHEIVDANPVAVSMIGASREQVLGRKCHKYICSVESGECPITDLGQEVDNSEHVLIKADGEEVPILKTVVSIVLDGRKCLLESFINIAERKQAEEALRESEERHRVITEAAQDAIITADAEGNIRFWNPAAEKIFGFTAAEAIGKNMMDLIVPPQYHEAKRKGLAEFGRTGYGAVIGRTLELTALRKDGSEIPIELSVSDYQDREGFRGVALIRDITGRNQASVELERAHAGTKQLLEAIPSILVGVDADGRVTTWNSAAERVLGIAAERVVGRLFHDLRVEWDRAAVARGVSECCANSKVTHLDDIRFKRTDGTDGFLGISLNPVIAGRDADGSFLLFAADITQRKILQVQLTQAQKLESIGQLAAGIAHEINTPTQFVGDNTRFLQDAFGDLQGLLAKYERLAEASRTGSVTPEILADVDAAAKEADLDYLNEQVPLAIAQALEGIGRVANIVRAMKDFSHPGGEGMEVVDLNRAIESTITVARNEWKYVAEMVTDFDPALPFVVCQIGDFNQVILNIVINAAHAIADVVGDGAAGKGTITVSTRRDGDWAEIRIRDTGTGIAPEHRSKVFDHFFTTKEVGRGTGQGLAIAHAVIAEKHGGTITFETETGKGTTFVIRLPIQPELATPKETPQHEAAYSLR